MAKQTFLIGVAGRSGSGKTELARRMAEWLAGQATIVSLDSYYHSLAHIPDSQRADYNFDHPDALDWDRIEQDVAELGQGRTIEEPIYDFATHTRSEGSRRVTPGRFVILDGIFALHNPEVRRLLDWRIFVDTPDRVCLERRMARDVVERGRTGESVIAQYDNTVRPMAEKFVDPQRDHAHLVVPGNIPVGEMLERATLGLRALSVPV